MTEPRTRLVGAGYDAMSDTWESWKAQITDDPRAEWCDSDTENWTGDFLGAPNYFSSFPPEANSRMLREAGFELLRDELVTIQEPQGEATFQWILARR